MRGDGTVKPIIYISGKITGDDNYKAKFAEVEKTLSEKGFNVINPCKVGECEFFSYEQFLHIDFALIDVADALFMLGDWKNSKGALREWHYAQSRGKTIIFQYELSEIEKKITRLSPFK